MLTVLLVIIYVAFISLGLPDAILGSAWPNLHQDLGVPISYAGIVTMIVAGGTIVSSFFSGRIIKKFGTGKVTTFSVFLTAAALLGIYFSPSFIWICILGIPLGLGAGAVASALNNFVALRYEAKHMNWLHCFWGIGATAGPFIMSLYLLKENGWRFGYL
ncbi:MFS transporter, partial [Clostridium saudiense]|nr:MFS transporter [Clostridium saudiense]